MADSPNHFFKFIRPGHKFSLSIPRSFWKNLNDERCKKAILRRGCHEWPVDISEEGGFRDGWRKFVKQNGVQEFDFIVFKHQGNMVFDFLVFDQSSCERQYPSLYDQEMDVEEKLADSDSVHTHERLKKLKKHKRTDYSSQTKDKLALDDDCCFVATITSYNIRKSRLCIPITFARSNGLTSNTQVILTDEAQRSWPAKLAIARTQIRLNGWRNLIEPNHLEPGDSCMLELVNHGEVPTFNIYNLGKKHIQKDQNDIAVNEASSAKPKEATCSTPINHRYFISTLKPCTFNKSCLYLPVDFSIPNGLKPGEMILRDEKGRSWTVQLHKNGEKHFYLGCGLKAFCDGNGLKKGDEYKLELVEKAKDKPPVMKFSLSVNSFFHEEGDRPYFIAKVKHYNIQKSILNLPNNFVKANGLNNREEMIIVNVKDERSWTVALERSRTNYCFIRRGWKDFHVANGLKEGDRFKLELVKNGEKPVARFYLQEKC